MKLFAKAVIAAALYSILCGAAAAHAAPVPTRLTADTMDYDIETGIFKAQGNVTIVRGGVSLTAPFGEANMQTSKARMWTPVRALGVYQNEPLDAVCTQLEADFSVPGTDILMNGNVDATFGQRVLRSDTARLVGNAFSATKVSHFEDKDQSLVISCDTIEGDYDSLGVRVVTGLGQVEAVRDEEQRLTHLWCDKLVYLREEATTTATGKPRMNVEQKQGSGPRNTLITGDSLVHSSVSNTVTANGNARATQDGRDIVAQRLIYNMDTGKLEARGTPRITVDLATLPSKSEKKQPSQTQQKGRKK